MEIIPVYANIIVKPYEENPYIQHVTKSGFIINDAVFDNPDTGERDMLVQEIVCGKVIEAGPDCKYVKTGDDIFYNSRTVKPIPYNRLGYMLCNEQGVLAIVGEDVKTRLKKQ